jgi:hypothetical protein
MSIPTAPRPNASGNDAFCAGQQRPPETAEDNALVAAGWRLFGTYESGWGTRVIGAQSDEDGMCRPLGYNFFVFVNGHFAGTVSPVLMDSRTDGSAQAPFVYGSGSTLSADFARYGANDPLCCPSSTTNVTYNITTSGGQPLLVPQNAFTNPNGH